jgi:hypothetical protein
METLAYKMEAYEPQDSVTPSSTVDAIIPTEQMHRTTKEHQKYSSKK